MTITGNRPSIRIAIVAIIVLLVFAGPAGAMPDKAENPAGIHTGKLLQMFKSGGYTYLEYESGGGKYWAASKTVVANIGDIIEFRQPLVMKDFYSKTLKRRFPLIYFAGMVRSRGTAGKLSVEAMKKMSGHSKFASKGKKVEVKPGSVKKAENGVTVEECFKNKKNLKGKEIILRGIVVKVSTKIKGRNWVHIRDGSGEKGSNDLTFTTKEALDPGDLVLVKGKLILNKDIGSGYKFPVFMEDPEITREEQD